MRDSCNLNTQGYPLPENFVNCEGNYHNLACLQHINSTYGKFYSSSQHYIPLRGVSKLFCRKARPPPHNVMLRDTLHCTAPIVFRDKYKETLFLQPTMMASKVYFGHSSSTYVLTDDNVTVLTPPPPPQRHNDGLETPPYS